MTMEILICWQVSTFFCSCILLSPNYIFCNGLVMLENLQNVGQSNVMEQKVSLYHNNLFSKIILSLKFHLLINDKDFTFLMPFISNEDL